jgi:hypothetical protein
MKPITPAIAAKTKQSKIPDVVIEAFNTLIAKEFDGNQARILQKDVVKEICKNSSYHAQDIYDNGYLDVEDTFRKASWKVVYDKPGYCESYEANFTFTRK